MFKIKNPIPDTVKDTKDLRKVIRGLKLIPYYGTSERSSHNYLKLLYDLYQLSPSQGTCINDINTFAFEGFPGLGKVADINDPEPEVSDQEKSQFAEIYSRLGLKFFDITAHAKAAGLHYKYSGNIFFRIRKTIVQGQPYYSIGLEFPYNCMYAVMSDEEADDPRMIFIAKDYSLDRLQKGYFRITSKFPEWTDHGDYFETIYHVKNDVDGNDWYGRPDSLQSIHWQVVEFLLSDQAVKIGSTNMVALYLLAFEAPEIETHTDSKDDRQSKLREKVVALRKLVTTSGDSPEAIGAVEYAKDSNPPEVLKFDIMRDYEWFESQNTIAKQHIFGSHRWPSELSGSTQSKSGIGSNIMKDLFLIKDETVIRPYQRFMSGHFNTIWNFIGQDSGQDIGSYIPVFPNNIINLVESINTYTNSNSGNNEDLTTTSGDNEVGID